MFQEKEELQLNGGVLHEKAAALGRIEIFAAGYPGGTKTGISYNYL